jgi:FkbM family methyltransferase
MPLLIRNNAGHRLWRLAQATHSLGVHAAGFGTADLPLRRSGETHTVRLLEGVSSPLVLDVGAFEGDYAMLAREILGRRATIHCFEPGQVGLPKLRERAATEDLYVHPVAVAAKSGRATLYSDPHVAVIASLHRDAMPTFGMPATRQDSVEATSIDDFCAQHGIVRVDLLKIDVEGTELDVLRGASRLIADAAISIIQFEFGYGDVASRTFMRDFYELLGATHSFHRVAPRGLIPLGSYHTGLEVFSGVTNYVAVNRTLSPEAR